LNGRSLGLYVLKEGFTDKFLSRHFRCANGVLYDVEEGHDVDQGMTVRHGRNHAAAQMPLRELAAAAREPDLKRRWERLREVLEVERFIKFMAVEVMLDHWDGYSMGRNNFRLHHDPNTGKLAFLPAGFDQVLANSRLTWKPQMSGMIAKAVLETPEGMASYSGAFREMFSENFRPARLTNCLQHAFARLRPMLPARVFRGVERQATVLCAEIVEREQNLASQLTAPGPVHLEPGCESVLITGWRPDSPENRRSALDETVIEGKPALRIAATGASSASWRASVRLTQGRYGFEGVAKTAGVEPLPFGRSQGASLRAMGQPRSAQTLTGDAEWAPLRAEFEVRDPEADIELVCELRAARGEAWFDTQSLRVVRRPAHSVSNGNAEMTPPEYIQSEPATALAVRTSRTFYLKTRAP
jgi:hypothetical protein